MKNQKLIRMSDDGPINLRNRDVAISRGVTKMVDAEVADKLTSEYDYLVMCCNTVKSDGELCSQTKGNCQYHDKENPDNGPSG